MDQAPTATMSSMIDNLAAYHFVAIDDPDTVAAWLHGLAGAGDLRGTVLVAPEGMGRLFKALCLCHPGLAIPPGFEPA